MHRDKRIWDFPTRLFHWALAASVITSLVSVNISAMETHIMSGGVVGALLLFRLMWGLWGASTAQFHRFVPTPGKLIAFLKGNAAYTGHSPLGALSVVAMLLALAVQVASGMVSDDEIYLEGPLRSEVTSATARFAGSVHAWTSEIIWVLIGLHLAAIVFYRLVRGKPLTRAMITGRGEGTDEVRPRPLWLSLATMAISAGVVLYIYWR